MKVAEDAGVPSPAVRPPRVEAPVIASPATEPNTAPLTPPAAFPHGFTDEDFSNTVVMPISAMFRTTRRIDDEGELMDLLAHKPLLLDDPHQTWLVVTGSVLIFCVAIDGRRTPFLGIVPGQCFFGFEPATVGTGSGFLAVAKHGTTVRKISRTRLRQIAADAHATPGDFRDDSIAGSAACRWASWRRWRRSGAGS